MTWDPQDEARFVAERRRRNLVIGIVLAAFAFLFYGITVSRMVT